MASEEHTEEEVLPLAATISLGDDEKSESFQKNADPETATTATELPTEEAVKPINPQTSIEKDIIINIDSASNEIETENKHQNEKNSIDKLDPNDLSAFTLIERAHSDPLALQSNTSQMMNSGENNPDLTLNKPRNSILASQKKHHSHDDILNKAELLDFGGFNIREFSVEVIGIKYDMKEEIVVPARDNLVKIPFYTTPLTLEATNNAFYDFRERLNDMGFVEQAEAALIHTQCESIENAVAFILHNMDAIYHRFGNSDESALGAINEENKTCTLCNASFDQHLIDYNGNKIEIGMNEDNYNHDADVINFGEDSSLAEEFQDDSVKIELRGIALNAERINEIIQKTESQFAAAVVYDGATEKCLICFEEKPVDFYMKSECGHDKYCKQCLTQHYKIKTKDGDVLKVKCIDPSCEREIREEEILNFLTDDKDIKEKFLKFKRQKLLMLNENARFCPSADCEGYMIGSRLKPKLICPECSTMICFNCSKLWHGYFTKCLSAQNAIQSAQNESDQKYYQWELNKDVKKCPKCKMRIEKTEGCNHMTCVSCKYEFCWVCKGKYNSNHFSQWNVFGCPGAQYNNQASICSIQRCPACMPMWLRRLLVIFAFILLLPVIIVFGILAGCVYGCAICVVFLFENVCSCC